MFTKSFVATAALVAGAYAQSTTDCDPLLKTCPANPAYGNEKYSCDLTQKLCDGLTPATGTDISDFSGKGALFSFDKPKQAPTVFSDKYLFFGRVDVEMQAAPGGGIISSIVLMSQDRDEIDWEFLGSQPDKVQTNIFSKGDFSKHDLGETNDAPGSLTGTHTYTVDWTPEAIKWIINGNVVRTLTAASIPGRYPQTPMRVSIGTWSAGTEGNDPGTIEWSGGPTNFGNAPFNAYYKSIKIVDYAGGFSPATKKVDNYSYGDHSGSKESIKISPEGSGNTGGNSGGDKPETSSTSAAPHTTTSHAKTSTSATTLSTTPKPATKTSSKAESTETETSSAAETSATDAPSTTESSSGTGTSSAAATSSTGSSSGNRAGVAAGVLAVAGVAALL